MDPETVLRFVKAVGGWPGKVVVIALRARARSTTSASASATSSPRRSTGRSSSSLTTIGRASSAETGHLGLRPTVHELSVASAIVDTATRHAGGRRVTAVSVRVGHAAPGRPGRRSPSTSSTSRADTRLRGRAARARGGPRAAALRRLRARSGSSTRPRSAARAAAQATCASLGGDELEVESIEIEEEACIASG